MNKINWKAIFIDNYLTIDITITHVGKYMTMRIPAVKE